MMTYPGCKTPWGEGNPSLSEREEMAATLLIIFRALRLLRDENEGEVYRAHIQSIMDSITQELGVAEDEIL